MKWWQICCGATILIALALFVLAWFARRDPNIKKLKAKRDVKRLTEASSHHDPQVRKAAAVALEGIVGPESMLPPVTGCKNCDHHSSGHLDRGTNWMRCAKGHRLIADEEFVREHHLCYDPDEEAVSVTPSGWATSGGSGEPMLYRTDCPDWKRRGFRLDLGNPEYDWFIAAVA